METYLGEGGKQAFTLTFDLRASYEHASGVAC